METRIKIKGMMCQHCVMHVSGALKGLKDVKKVSVDLGKGEALIESKAALTEAELKKAITEAGYDFGGII